MFTSAPKSRAGRPLRCQVSNSSSFCCGESGITGPSAARASVPRRRALGAGASTAQESESGRLETSSLRWRRLVLLPVIVRIEATGRRRRRRSTGRHRGCRRRPRGERQRFRYAQTLSFPATRCNASSDRYFCSSFMTSSLKGGGHSSTYLNPKLSKDYREGHR